MKARVFCFHEIEKRFGATLTELEHRPWDEALIIGLGCQLLFTFRLCIRQMKARAAAHTQAK
jgi:hypothetical protein